jgi:hypothetical protein
MGAVTVTNNAPGLIEVVTTEILERHDDLTHKSATVPITNEAEKIKAEALAKSLRALKEEIENKRKDGTAILDIIKAAAITLEREYTGTLDECWKALITRINAFIDAENLRRAAEAKKARDDAAALQKIEDDKAAEKLRLLQEQADLDALPDALPVEVPVTKALPVIIPERYVAPLMTYGATRKKTTYSLKWIDASKAPITSPMGHRLLKPDDQEFIAYLKMLPAGKREIEGCVQLIETTGVAAKG